MHVGTARYAAGSDSQWARRWFVAGLLGATALSAGLLPSPSAAVEAPLEPPTYRLESVAAETAGADESIETAPRVLLSEPAEPGFLGTLARLAELELAFGQAVAAPTTNAEVAAQRSDAQPAPPPAEASVATRTATPTPAATPAANPASVPATLPTPRPVEVVAPLPPSVALSAKESGLLLAMNRQRAAADLEPLVVRADLTEVARSRSQDMVSNDYFGHFHESGTSAYSMLTSAGVGYGSAGENLAKVPGDDSTAVQLAIEALMASPTHRENILRGDYQYVGVGERVNADGITILTTIFTDR